MLGARGAGGPAIRLRGEWLASAQQATRLEAQSAELHAQLAARDASNHALQLQCREVEASFERARAELAAVSAELGQAQARAASARAATVEREVAAHTLARDLPLFENSHSAMLKSFQALQQRLISAEHARQIADVSAEHAATDLARMTKLNLGANAQVNALKHKLRAAEDELLEARRRAAEQQRHAHVLQRERERLNDLIGECRRQMKELKLASASAAAAYTARRAGTAGDGALEQAAATIALPTPVTARWTGGACAGLAAPPSPPTDAPRTPTAAPDEDAPAEAAMSGARTGKAALRASATRKENGRVGSAPDSPSDSAPNSAPAGRRRAAAMSAADAQSVRAQLFGGGGAGARKAGGGVVALESQDDAFVSVVPGGLAPVSRFQNWALATAEQREEALREENGSLLLALQAQLQRCGQLEQTIAQLRAENVQLKYTRPRVASAAPRAPARAAGARSAVGGGEEGEGSEAGRGAVQPKPARKAPLPLAARMSLRAEICARHGPA
ncbi:hypothetical protein KFE25_006699 [Diacronema lutheri]|uniref:Uncharacterized protein n=1 Tax=Diacronema lutheri TaxID=2081491 RepID=A0A8J6CAH3_DIALT|nr:hypothetical protein KFE25_006699 [Diacronema lutheri]